MHKTIIPLPNKEAYIVNNTCARGRNDLLKKLCLVLAAALLIAGLCSNVQAHSGDEVVAVYGTAPTIDGTISTGEWDDASTVTFTVAEGGTCTVYVKQDGNNLYVAFDIPDTTTSPADASLLHFDVDHNDQTIPQSDDFRFYVQRCGWQGEYHGDGSGWQYDVSSSGWSASIVSTVGVRFQVEYSVSYSKIGVTAGQEKTLGVGFVSHDHDYVWPAGYDGWPSGCDTSNPSTWANLTSPDPFFWIPGIPSTLGAVALMLVVAAYRYTKKQS